MNPETKFRILLLYYFFKTLFLQYLRCRLGTPLDPAVLRRAGPLAGMGGGPGRNGSRLPRPACIIGNDLKNYRKFQFPHFHSHHFLPCS
jgi:hypothetical protein